jgi:hypothetical protein
MIEPADCFVHERVNMSHSSESLFALQAWTIQESLTSFRSAKQKRGHGLVALEPPILLTPPVFVCSTLPCHSMDQQTTK